MSFTITVSGHTTEQENFESVVEAAKDFAETIDGSTQGNITAVLTGTDHNGQSVSLHLTEGLAGYESLATPTGGAAVPPTPEDISRGVASPVSPVQKDIKKEEE